MSTKLNIFNQTQLKKDLPDIRPGDVIRVYQKIKDYYPPSTSSRAKGAGPSGEKERVQVFEGQVLGRKHGQGITSTITVRKVVSGIGVERIFPVHLPTIEKIEILKRGKVRRAKLYYLRRVKGKKARLKKKEFGEAIVEKKPEEMKK